MTRLGAKTPPEPPEEEEEEIEIEKPELAQEIEPLQLNQLDFALNPGVGDALGFGSGVLGFEISPDSIAQMDVFGIDDLDESPRRIFAVQPVYPLQLRREHIAGSVTLSKSTALSQVVKNRSEEEGDQVCLASRPDEFRP